MSKVKRPSGRTTAPGVKAFGKFQATPNMVRAETYIRTLGYGTEFTHGQFADATGILKGTVSGILVKLIEAGVVASYPHDRFHGQMKYRVAWPVLIRRIEETERGRVAVSAEEAQASVALDHVPNAETFTVDEGATLTEDGAYNVKLRHPETGAEWYLTGVLADSPEQAAERARHALKATVMKTWEL